MALDLSACTNPDDLDKRTIGDSIGPEAGAVIGAAAGGGTGAAIGAASGGIAGAATTAPPPPRYGMGRASGTTIAYDRPTRAARCSIFNIRF